MKLVIDRPKNWPILKNNKKIYVISPAYSSSLEEILKINKFLENWGLEGIFYQPKERNDLEFLSNSDSDRLNELKNALYGDESEIIFCSAGGYGSARIVRKLLKSKEAIKNKLFSRQLLRLLRLILFYLLAIQIQLYRFHEFRRLNLIRARSVLGLNLLQQ